MQRLPWHQRADRRGAHPVPRVLDEAVAGAARRLRRRAAARAGRPLQPVPRHRHHRDPAGAVRRRHRRARAAVSARHLVAVLRLRADEPAGAARGRRPAVAEERPRDRARHPAGDAAERPLHRARRRNGRHEPAGQHRRRRLLRHPAARRRAAGDHARRRRRQGQPGGAAHGAAARDAAHAGRREARAGRSHHAPQRPGLPPRAGHALHHAVLRRVRSAHRLADLRQRRPHAAAAAARRRQLRAADRRRHLARHVRALDVHHRPRRRSSPTICSRSTATASPRRRASRACRSTKSASRRR